MTGFHEFEMASIDGDMVALSSFRDTSCLVVNVASK